MDATTTLWRKEKCNFAAYIIFTTLDILQSCAVIFRNKDAW